MTNLLGLISFYKQDCLCCSLCCSRWSHRDHPRRCRKLGAAAELEWCELPKQLRWGMRQQDTWNLTKLAISCCMKAALADYPKGLLGSASKSRQQQMTRAGASVSNRYLSLPCVLHLETFSVNVASIVASSSLYELIKAFITYNNDFPTVLDACFGSVTC